MRVVRCEDKDEETASADSAVGDSTTFVGSHKTGRSVDLHLMDKRKDE